MDLDHLVRGQEAVLDALPQRVGVNRRPKIMDVGNVLGFFGRGGESDLGSAREVVEDILPCRVVSGAATMALVNDDQVKKAGREFPVDLLALLRPRDGLIKPQIDLVGGVDATLFVERRGEFDLGAVFPLDGLGPRAELCHRRAERPEIIHHCLIYKDVAVGKEEDAFLAPGFP